MFYSISLILLLYVINNFVVESIEDNNNDGVS